MHPGRATGRACAAPAGTHVRQRARRLWRLRRAAALAGTGWPCSRRPRGPLASADGAPTAVVAASARPGAAYGDALDDDDYLYDGFVAYGSGSDGELEGEHDAGDDFAAELAEVLAAPLLSAQTRAAPSMAAVAAFEAACRHEQDTLRRQPLLHEPLTDEEEELMHGLTTVSSEEGGGFGVVSALMRDSDVAACVNVKQCRSAHCKSTSDWRRAGGMQMRTRKVRICMRKVRICLQMRTPLRRIEGDIRCRVVGSRQQTRGGE